LTEIPLWRRLAAEYVGSALLAAIVIGSGIGAQQLSPGQTGLLLFGNAAATAPGLIAIILMFGAVSGAHFNPVVSLLDAAFGGMSWRQAAAYLPAQGGRVLGWSRCSMWSRPAPACASTRPSRPGIRRPLARAVQTITRPTIRSPTPSPSGSPVIPSTGRLLGAQLVGRRGTEIAKRVDI
jgi:arsenate reductase